MKIPPYWVTGRCEIAGMNFRMKGSSETSMDDAQARMSAREGILRRFYEEGGMAVEDFREQLASFLKPGGEGCAYEADIFEPIVERLDAANIVTRNRYGAEVLNSTELCFVDVDEFPASGWEHLKSLFGGKKRSDEERLMEALENLRWAHGVDSRLYRTAAGWRAILTGEGLTPTSEKMADVFHFVHADWLYRTLCAKQNCWRARLTPKYGRLPRRIGRFPRRSASDTPAEGEAEWLAAYAEACEGYAVCRLVESFGSPIRHPLVAWHDERTLALKDGIPLA